MSTRCQIAIYADEKFIETDKGIENKFDVLLYRHSDGYPGKIDSKDNKDIGVLPDILPFIKAFMRVRGWDIEYLGACLISYLKYWHCGEKSVDKDYTYYRPEENVILNGFEINPLSHGVCKAIHWDIEYLYAITPKKLVVFKTEYKEDKKDKLIFNYKKIGEYPLMPS